MMPSFLHNIADKAQNALNATPIGAHVPPLPGTSTGSQESTQTATVQSGRSYAFENVQHQLRILQQQYSGNATPVQKLITAQKGVAIDFEGVSRDLKAQSKELYLWGQGETDDLKDVSDRLAYISFVHGSLAATLSTKLDSSRAPLKSLRDVEASLAPQRNVRMGIMQQITRIKNDGQKSSTVDRRLSELHESLRKAEKESEDAEKQLEIRKRQFLRECEEAEWGAIREYAEKLILLSQASTSFLNVLPAAPLSPESPYSGSGITAGTRAALQRALDNWATGHVKIPILAPSEDNEDSDTRSFGETHASELSSIAADTSSTTSIPASVALNAVHFASSSASSHTYKQHPIDPSKLNQSPAPIPALTSNVTNGSDVVPEILSPPTVVSSPEASTFPQSTIPISPTIAETGIPISAGANGPGPQRGSLNPAHKAPSYGSTASGSQEPKVYESAEEEKKRLEREERERVLRRGGSNEPLDNLEDDISGVPPPYQDF